MRVFEIGEQLTDGWDELADDAPIVPETRAVRYRIKPTSTAESINEDFSRLAAHGFNTVIITAFAQGRTLFPCPALADAGIAAIHPAFRRRDPLAEALAAADETGLRTLAHAEVLHVGTEGVTGKGPILKRHPRWTVRRFGWRRSLEGPDAKRRFICPSVPAARRLLGDIFYQLVERYPVRGLFLNELRYPRELISPERNHRARDLEAFLKSRDPDRPTVKYEAGDPAFRAWQEWRNEQLNDLLYYLHCRLECASSRLWIVSQAVGPYDQEAFRGGLQGDWGEWLRRRYINAVAPSYRHEQGEAFRAALSEDIASIPPNGALYPLLDATDLRGGAERLRMCREQAVAGFVFRDFHAFEDRDWSIVRELFEQPALPTEERPRQSARWALGECRRILQAQPDLADLFADIVRVLPMKIEEDDETDERLSQSIIENLRGLEERMESGDIPLADEERTAIRWLNLARRCLLMGEHRSYVSL